jgi:hypothetical protein
VKHIVLWTVSIAAVVAVAGGCSSMPATQAGHPSLADTEAALKDAAMFKEKCASCHDLARVEEAHAAMSRDDMRKVIERMQSMPDSGIESTDVDRLLNEIYGPDPGT